MRGTTQAHSTDTICHHHPATCDRNVALSDRIAYVVVLLGLLLPFACPTCRSNGVFYLPCGDLCSSTCLEQAEEEPTIEVACKPFFFGVICGVSLTTVHMQSIFSFRRYFSSFPSRVCVSRTKKGKVAQCCSSAVSSLSCSPLPSGSSKVGSQPVLPARKNHRPICGLFYVRSCRWQRRRAAGDKDSNNINIAAICFRVSGCSSDTDLSVTLNPLYPMVHVRCRRCHSCTFLEQPPLPLAKRLGCFADTATTLALTLDSPALCGVGQQFMSPQARQTTQREIETGREEIITDQNA